MKKYTCGICGKEHTYLDDYLKCVANCGEAIKLEENKKRMEEMNIEINRVKQAKKYYEEQLANFKEKYPEEYKLNFGKEENKNEDVKKVASKPEINKVEKTDKVDKEYNEKCKKYAQDVLNEIDEFFRLLNLQTGK